MSGIATVVAARLWAQRLDELQALAPQLIEFALAPYLGAEEASRIAQAAAY